MATQRLIENNDTVIKWRKKISDSIRNDKEHKMNSLFVLESILTAGGDDMFLSNPIHF